MSQISSAFSYNFRLALTAAKLTMQKDADYQEMRDMRDEIKAVESLRQTADRLARDGQHQQKENER